MKHYQLLSGLMALSLLVILSFLPVSAQDEAPGDLILVDVESVTPAHVAEYTQWGKEFKAIAEETNFKSFWVGNSNTDYSYAWNIGPSISGIEEFEKQFEKWASANPKVGELNAKYSHTMVSRTRMLWRHLPKYSYNPEGYDGSEDTYVRTYRAWIVMGKGSEAMSIIEEYKQLMAEAGISSPFNLYRNVFGESTNCIAFRSTYKDAAAWATAQAEINEKVNQEKMQALYAKWVKVIIKGEDSEAWMSKDLTHIQKDM